MSIKCVKLIFEGVDRLSRPDFHWEAVVLAGGSACKEVSAQVRSPFPRCEGSRPRSMSCSGGSLSLLVCSQIEPGLMINFVDTGQDPVDCDHVSPPSPFSQAREVELGQPPFIRL